MNYKNTVITPLAIQFAECAAIVGLVAGLELAEGNLPSENPPTAAQLVDIAKTLFDGLSQEDISEQAKKALYEFYGLNCDDSDTLFTCCPECGNPWPTDSVNYQAQSCVEGCEFYSDDNELEGEI